jgi:endo-1,3(4)-beta-glucanase
LFSLTPIRGFIRVAILPVQNFQPAFTSLMQYVRRYPTGAVVALQYPSDQVAVVDVEYTTVGDGELLMLSLPHHETVMVEPDLNSANSVRVQEALAPIWCIKGKLKAVLGAKWRLQYNLTQVGWNYMLSDKLSTSRMDEIGANLLREVSQVAPTAADPYSFGKQLQRLATLALLADNLGIADARKTAMEVIKAALTPWLLGTNSNAFVYDSTYGGLLSANSLTDKFSDFGAGWYSDHHFHYGYIIYAAAVVAKLDSGAQGYFSDVTKKNAMALLVKDICGMDDQGTDFPFARHKDLFDGHSWASGLFQQGNGKGQESSSEVQ